MNDRRFFTRVDENPDDLFYQDARLVEHIDARAIAAVENVYRTWIPPESRVLDLMSSWVSHLPPDIRYASVTGLGMNATELASNSRLDRRIVHDLNAEPYLPFDDAAFDVALICVSVQYLTHPIEVMRELTRVVRSGGRTIVTFSNRCFPTKAVAIWQATDDAGHMRLVEGYLKESGWNDVRAFAHVGRGDPLYALVAEHLGGDLGNAQKREYRFEIKRFGEYRNAMKYYLATLLALGTLATSSAAFADNHNHGARWRADT